MSDQRSIDIDVRLSVAETSQLAALIEQFSELLTRSNLEPAEPDLERLAPDAYPGDPDASEDFRRLTRGDLLTRRASDAGSVLRSLHASGGVVALAELDGLVLDGGAVEQTVVVRLDEDDANAWMRTLAAVRLVLAGRLGIQTGLDLPSADPRAVLYDWLAVLLDGVVEALSVDRPVKES